MGIIKCRERGKFTGKNKRFVNKFNTLKMQAQKKFLHFPPNSADVNKGIILF